MDRPKIGIYMRLSHDDDKAGESMSIENQRLILRAYAEGRGEIVEEYVDDGYSGTNFERPAVKRLLEDAKEGRIDTIVVKDLSRFGRNYIQVGQFVDYLFPCYGIRFIALSDNIDTADRSSAAMDMMPIVNVFNEWHASNTSRKIRAVFDAKQRAGKYTNWSYPYGYKAGKDERRTAIVDEPAASVVRRIYAMRAEGASLRRIARTLSDEGIPNPMKYYTRLDGTKSLRKGSSLWSAKTVMEILSDRTYLGTVTQHRTARVSYKNHQTVRLPESEWVVRENAHEPIVSRKIWDRVQTVNNAVSRGREDKEHTVHPFSALFCPDCGKKLKFQTYGKGRSGYICRTYKDHGRKYCTSHYISEARLTQLVLIDLKEMLHGFTWDEEKEKRAYLRERAEREEKNRAADEKRLGECMNRLKELDKLLGAAFEEKVLGSMPETVFRSLSASFEEERQHLEAECEELRARLAPPAAGEGAEEYIAALGRYAECRVLTREMSLALVEKITVGEAADVRQIHICYRFEFV